jgi:hypothetical protein
MVALTLLRLLQFRLHQGWGMESWWSKPEWNTQKYHASIRGPRCLIWRHRAVFSQLLVTLQEREKSHQAFALPGTSVSRAACNPGNDYLNGSRTKLFDTYRQGGSA